MTARATCCRAPGPPRAPPAAQPDSREVPVVAPPIRILLLTARPEDDGVRLLRPPQQRPAAGAGHGGAGRAGRTARSRPAHPARPGQGAGARRASRRALHVVHFDGHGVYDRQVGLGGAAASRTPATSASSNERRHQTGARRRAGGLLRDHGIPLVFLEACQTAQVEKAVRVGGAELLKEGVASVVAMSHSVLVATAGASSRLSTGRWPQAAGWARPCWPASRPEGRHLPRPRLGHGRAAPAGLVRARALPGEGRPALFTALPSAARPREDWPAERKRRWATCRSRRRHGFVGRSRELLRLERLLGQATRATPWSAARAGEGKTALAAELARWMVRSHQVRPRRLRLGRGAGDEHRRVRARQASAGSS